MGLCPSLFCACSYPYNLDFDYGPLEGLQKYCINNLGDPFIESNYGVHSREFEIGVLQWFARLWEIDADDFWGYITNCGTGGWLDGRLCGWVLEQTSGWAHREQAVACVGSSRLAA